jgi:hypothetical protein
MKTLDSETLEPEVYHMNPKKSDNPGYRRVMKLFPTAFATYGSYLYKVREVSQMYFYQNLYFKMMLNFIDP